MEKKSCYTCKKYPVCYARIMLEKITLRPMIELAGKEKLFDTIAIYCNQYEKEPF